MIRFYIFSMFMLGVMVFLFLSVKPSFTDDEDEECPENMVPVGDICIDKFEASVWSLPPDEEEPQGTQFGVASDDYPCSDNGNDCSASAANPIFAASVANVIPSRFITWVQAQQACANVRKRLPTNAEWQMAAAGTPDPVTDNGATDCNHFRVSGTLPEDPVPTGSRSNCVSNWGAFDMVGNLYEWVADWVPLSTACVPSLFGTGDLNCLAGASTTSGPGAITRGGDFNTGIGDPNYGLFAGVFYIRADFGPSSSTGPNGGFRCALYR
ncbi:MAG: formylglycine-generating enzyme family protein [Thermodesulfobacteriota bacterium]